MLQGTDKIRGLNFAGSRKQKFEAEKFASMQNLHYLALDKCYVIGNFGCISKELRWLQWRYMPMAHLPAELDLSNLGRLDLSFSTNLAFLWADSNASLEVCSRCKELSC